jgi:hypothetical protein
MEDFFEEFYSLSSPDQAALYRTMAEKAIQLGYKAKREKAKQFGISFSSSKYKVTILRFTADKNKPAFRLKFFAAPHYSAVFERSLKKVIERFDFKYTGCYGCNKCKDEKEGYTIRYDDGREYFRCGFELIDINELNEQVKDEVLELLTLQTEYYAKKER